jgi:hypothetical protein
VKARNAQWKEMCRGGGWNMPYRTLKLRNTDQRPKAEFKEEGGGTEPPAGEPKG